LQTGYQNALAAAQQQRLNQLNAGQTAGTLQGQFNTNQTTAGQVAGNTAAQEAAARSTAATGQVNLGQQQQQSGLADVNALATLGGQQQTIAQNKELFPLDVAGKQMAALSGAQIPTTTMQTMTGSPLSAIAGLGALAGGMFSKNASGTSAAGNIYGAVAPVLSDIYGGAKDAYNNFRYSTDPNANANYTGGPNEDFDQSYPEYKATGPTSTGYVGSDASEPSYWDQFNFD
jgi:hypothetical protein